MVEEDGPGNRLDGTTVVIVVLLIVMALAVAAFFL